jgi:hypothetical protein
VKSHSEEESKNRNELENDTRTTVPESLETAFAKDRTSELPRIVGVDAQSLVQVLQLSVQQKEETQSAGTLAPFEGAGT